MKLSDIAAELGTTAVGASGDPAGSDVDIRGVTDDSRGVGAGDLFVAVRGLTVDGHRFVDQAVRAGAAAVVVERECDVRVPQLVVPSGARALGVLVARELGRPGDDLRLVGITGTNGKTTTSYLVESLLRGADRSPGVIGTVSYRYGGSEYPAPYTTPTPRVLHQTFADMTDAGVTDAVLEVSSAAIDMERMSGVQFAVAAFTNLTQDHLDIHGTMEAYQGAKARLFSELLAPDGVAVINIDDPAGAAMVRAAGDRRQLLVSARVDADADVRVVRARSTIDGIEATLQTPRGDLDVASPALLGAYNIDNVALAVAIGEALELDHGAMARGIADMAGVPGRVERVNNRAGLDILVDYAHTPDALANVLDAVKPLTRRRLICVFGCGGDRDPGKRPKMGAAVAQRADLAIVTSDNPRTENPQAIIDMILPAVKDPFYVDADRRRAIAAAVAEATPGDIVVIAGKGHEDYQILGTEKVHFDDREQAAEAAAVRPELILNDVVRVTGATIAAHGAESFTRVVIDGRTAAPGDLYVAIRGETHDGHAFCDQALDAGAVGVLVARGKSDALAPRPGITMLEVDDPRTALGKLGQLQRQRWGKPLIGVTGSAGKTTTKELIAAALSAAGGVHKSAGSLNNETGVPLTLLGLRPHHDRAVVEMGMRGLGQIAYLAEMAEPDVGVVVNAGTAHIGVVGSADAIARGKAEMFAHLAPRGTAIHPADDPRLAQPAKAAARQLSFGWTDDADVSVAGVTIRGAGGMDVELRVPSGDAVTARIPLIGRHNALNAACALAAAIAAGVPAEDAAAAMSRTRIPALRGELRAAGDLTLFVDCYNANPASMAAALDTLAETAEAGKRFAVLADMLELGDSAASAHAEVGRAAAERGVAVVALGEFAGDVVRGARQAGGTAEVAADPDAAAHKVRADASAGSWVLIKASRGMKLERVADALASDSAAGEGSAD